VSLALYRKYRPGSFAEVKGQEHVTEPLQQALRNGRIHHAYLFSGPRGCGKTSSARILARSLNCEQGPTPDPCGTCESCVALAPNGPGSLDVVEIDAASHGGVDDARDLRERAFYAPVSSRYKIYIIDEAHMVSREGFNALLKLVEEPPEFLRFVFATTEPEKVLATIRSRTHHYPFRLMPRKDLTELLAGIVASEGIEVDPTVLPLVVRAAAGSARDGLSILDQVLASAGSEGVTRETAASLLGVTPDTLLDDVVDAFAARDAAAVFAAVDRVMENGHDPRRFASDVLERLRDLIVLDAVPEAGDKGLLDCPPEQLAAMARQVSSLGSAGLSRAADVFHAGLTEMRGTTSPRLLLELMCARVLLPAASSDEAAVLTRLERLERRLDITGAVPAVDHKHVTPAAAPGAPTAAPAPAQPAPAAAPKPAAAPSAVAPAAAAPAAPPAASAPPAQAPAPTSWPAAAVPGKTGAEPSPAAAAAPVASGEPVPPGGIDVVAMRRAWDAVMDTVKNMKRTTWAALMDAQVQEVDAKTLTLAFTRAGNQKNFMAGANVDYLNDALQTVLGRTFEVASVIVGAAAEPQPEVAAPVYEGMAPGDEVVPEDPDVPAPERVVGGEDEALRLVAEQLGATVLE
jgi:DNA polymerase-3 subunit gamma/tau